MKNFLYGQNKCGTYINPSNGNVLVMNQSLICYILTFLMFFSVLQNVSYILDNKNNIKEEIKNSIIILLLIQSITLFIMWNHCTRCNGIQGFLKVFLISTVIQIVTNNKIISS